MRSALFAAFAFLAVVAVAEPVGAAPDPVLETVFQTIEQDDAKRNAAREELVKRGKPDVVPALIQLKRFLNEDGWLDEALAKLTGESGTKSWHDWILWQEAHTEIQPFPGFELFKARIYSRIDPNFEVFLYEDLKHEIRLEEIVWGGVAKDGIPALVNPELLQASEATYLTDDELVFGISINGDSRAYPLRILDWHEMFNDVIGGVPVALAYCTLCGSGILFETMVEGRDRPFVFGSSGFLYRSNKLMYDGETHSLWNQFTGRPVVGRLTGSGIELKTRPVVITSWAAWKKSNPDTRVISLNTGYKRDYRPGAPYGEYFASPDLLFPALVERKELKPKDFVFALRSSGTDKAWPLKMFEGGKVINDQAGILEIVLIGDAESRTVRAYKSKGLKFQATTDASKLKAEDGSEWTISEEALMGPGGEKLDRLPGHIAYWFAWAGYLGKSGEVASQ